MVQSLHITGENMGESHTRLCGHFLLMWTKTSSRLSFCKSYLLHPVLCLLLHSGNRDSAAVYLRILWGLLNIFDMITWMITLTRNFLSFHFKDSLGSANVETIVNLAGFEFNISACINKERYLSGIEPEVLTLAWRCFNVMLRCGSSIKKIDNHNPLLKSLSFWFSLHILVGELRISVLVVCYFSLM